MLEYVGNVEGTETSKVDVFRAVFGVQAGGNVNPRGDPHGELKGQNVLTRIDCDTEAVVEGMSLKDEAQLEAVVEACCQILHQKRQSRPRPHLDDKILTSWNGLMITGLCLAYQALGDVAPRHGRQSHGLHQGHHVERAEKGALQECLQGGR